MSSERLQHSRVDLERVRLIAKDDPDIWPDEAEGINLARDLLDLFEQLETLESLLRQTLGMADLPDSQDAAALLNDLEAAVPGIVGPPYPIVLREVSSPASMPSE